MNWRHVIDLLRGEMSSGIVSSSMARLVLAAILVGIIGLERELKHKPAGLRTRTQREQKRLLEQLKASRVLGSVAWIGPVDRE
ncbi:MAG: MgtC/SapB family protein [Acidobacteriia bacterium]|nr:MgtC/SapB family protein [Terriglobia bacterium]